LPRATWQSHIFDAEIVGQVPCEPANAENEVNNEIGRTTGVLPYLL